MINFSFCIKCCHKKTEPMEPTKGGIIADRLIGCTELTKEEWDEGLAKDGIFNQLNCPLIGKEGRKNG